jgi:hypothetical protein
MTQSVYPTKERLMYEVRCIVGDKKLREVLIFLNNNNTLEPPVVIPVGPSSLKGEAAMNTTINEAVVHLKKPKPDKKRRKPVQTGGRHQKGTGSVQVVRAFMAQTGATHISAREMKQATIAAGYSPNAYSHAVKLLIADKTIRPIPGHSGAYTVTTPTISEAMQYG